MKLLDLLRALGTAFLPVLVQWLNGLLCPECREKVRAELNDTPPGKGR